MRALLISTLLFLAAPNLIQAHEYYVSITEIVYDEPTNSLQISLKIFTDDLDEGLKGVAGEYMQLDTPDENDLSDFHVFEYLKSHIKVLVNGTNQKLEYVGKEYEDDVTWCYIEVPNVGKMDRLKIYNDLLMELFADQLNMIDVMIDDGSKRLTLTKDAIADEVTF